MKQVKFKKWIITATISFILAIIFTIMSMTSGGTTLFNSIYSTGNSIANMATEFASDSSHQIAGDWNFKIGNDEHGSCLYTINQREFTTNCSNK